MKPNDVDGQLAWDLCYLAFGLAQIAFGLELVRSGRADTTPRGYLSSNGAGTRAENGRLEDAVETTMDDLDAEGPSSAAG